MKKKIHQPYDKLQKSFTKSFANETLAVVGINSEVKEFIATEIISIHNKSKFVDILLKTEDGLQVHIEFHKDNISEDILYRNGAYSMDLLDITKTDVIPVFICLGERSKSKLKIDTSEHYSFTPLCNFPREEDGDQLLNSITTKIDTKENLTRKEIYYLVFLPFTTHEKSDEEVAEEIFELVNHIPQLSEKQLFNIKKCHEILLQIFFSEDEEKLEKLSNVITMSCDYFNRYEEKIVTEGIRKNNMDIARKLKAENICSLDKISDITNLKLSTIEKL